MTKLFLMMLLALGLAVGPVAMSEDEHDPYPHCWPCSEAQPE